MSNRQPTNGGGTLPPVIRVENLSRVYMMGGQEIHAVRDLTLEVPRGAYYAVMGPSGSGKSTLMNLIGCLDRPTKGSYFLNGQEVAVMSDDELASLRNQEIGFVFQSFHLLARTSALENVSLPLIYAGVSRQERTLMCEEALVTVGLSERMDHLPEQLSGGERQRVAIARALVNKPSLILADEPTGALDTKTGGEILDLFDRLHEEGNTILLVTHEREVAERTERTLLFRDGCLQP